MVLVDSLKRVQSIYDAVYLQSELSRFKEKFALIGDVRGIDLLCGIELVKDTITKEKAIVEAEKVMYASLKRGLSFKVPAGNVLQLSPALTISREELKEALQILEESLTIVQHQKNE